MLYMYGGKYGSCGLKGWVHMPSLLSAATISLWSERILLDKKYSLQNQRKKTESVLYWGFTMRPVPFFHGEANDIRSSLFQTSENERDKNEGGLARLSPPSFFLPLSLFLAPNYREPGTFEVSGRQLRHLYS